MLNDAIRSFARRFFGGEHITVAELNETADRLETMPGKADTYVSGAVGIAEGIGQRALTVQMPEDGIVRKVGRAEKKAASYLAIAGVLSPPDPEQLEKLIDAVVSQAKANKYRLESGERVLDFPRIDHFADMSRAMLGINKGDDKIVEVRLRKSGSEVEVHAFDKRGFHVMEAYLSKSDPGVLYIDALRATHGRNCDDLALDFGGAGVPGRGNALAIAAGLEALILECARHGVHTIATSPGSPMVASLYMKMGFTEPGSKEPFAKRRLAWLLEQFPILAEGVQTAMIIKKQNEESYVQRLDLTNAGAVRQSLAAFQLSRVAVQDVPKDVTRRLLALGQKAPVPAHPKWMRELKEKNPNVRVIR